MIGLPSLRALDRTHGPRIWLAVEVTDMRCGFDRLAERVRAVIGQDPMSDSLFIFRSRRGDRLKILLWSATGSCYGTSGLRVEFSNCRASKMELVQWS
jgi:transposase